MAQQQPLILPLAASKGRSCPRLFLSHFGMNTQILPFGGVALVLGPLSLLVKIPSVLCARTKKN